MREKGAVFLKASPAIFREVEAPLQNLKMGNPRDHIG
jgi:hypothetical protein